MAGLIAKIQLLFNLCAEHKINLMARDGFLLGIIRHEGFMTYDIDPDVMIHEKDLHRLKNINKLSNNMFYFRQHTTLYDVFYIYCGKQMIGEGVCLIEKNNKLYQGKKLYGNNEAKLFYECYGHSKDEEAMYKYKSNDIYPLKTGLFYGKKILIPKNSVKILKEHYGPDVLTYYVDKYGDETLTKKLVNDSIKYKPNQKEVDKLYIYYKMVICSGPHVSHINNNNNIRDKIALYSSFHFPDFTFTNSLRNVLTAFKEFYINDLSNKKVLDIGCNIGSFSFECLNRKAKFVKGIEYNKKRVEVCKDLAKYLNVENKCQFECLDLNKLLSDKVALSDFIKTNQSDVVICKAVDAYIFDKFKLYDLIKKITKKTCYFETNSNITSTDFFKYMRPHFNNLINLGTSKSDKGYGRNSYILSKTQLLDHSIRKNTIYEKALCNLDDCYIVRYRYSHFFNILKKHIEKIIDAPFMPKIQFGFNSYCVEKLNNCLFAIRNRLTLDEKKDIKKQVIAMIKYLNNKGLAHRDLHCKNLFYDNNTLYLIDYEFLTENKVKLIHSYDLTGKGLVSPLKSNNMNIFYPNPVSVKSVLFPVQINLSSFS